MTLLALQKLEECLSNASKQNRNTDECLHYLDKIALWIQPDMIYFFVKASHAVQKELIFSILLKTNPAILLAMLDDLLSLLIQWTKDPLTSIRLGALEVIRHVLDQIPNRDLQPLIPVVYRALHDLTFTSQAIEELAGCVFVQNVEASTLAVIRPLLQRGLRANTNEIKRKSCLILDNLCKLVDDPVEMYHFATSIYPQVQQVAEYVSHPEVREIAQRVLRTMSDVYDAQNPPEKKTLTDALEILRKHVFLEKQQELETATLLKNLCNANRFDQDLWYNVLPLDKDMIRKIFKECIVSLTPSSLFFEDTDEGLDLYRGTFSLAYGNRTLLKNTNLHLKRNRFYGLLGPNNCGKTTLMRAIHNEQIEGFPRRDELRTIFVEHEIHEREIGQDNEGYAVYNTDLSGIDWVLDYCGSIQLDRETVIQTMEDIGFATKDGQNDRAADARSPITTYSGGWKMKMQLCAATLLEADILMLDEPTGHLDVANIEWLKMWLRGFLAGGGSIITTSHDSIFLDAMCTHIIDFQKRKLVTFKGTLMKYVEKYPEKCQYFVLKNDVVRFEFPEPGPLEGVKSLSKTLLKMVNCSYKYPTRDEPTVQDICLDCSRISRVAVIGLNGAGKSTAIKMLIGELNPTEGVVTKHPNLRVAYVAQHALYHLEKHMNSTPAQYIMWRFAGCEDKESLEFLHRSQKRMQMVQKYFLRDNELYECHTREELLEAVEPDAILTKHCKDQTYEVKWKHRSIDATTWVHRDTLVNMGAERLVQKHDEKVAAENGLMHRALTTRAICDHLSKFGLDNEDTAHTLIRSLSGGQKIKVVLGASMWFNPHLVILDEPTNYLDRDSLGALTKAIQEFKGGVVIISHNREFADAICQEKWFMERGRLRREGQSIGMEENTIFSHTMEETIIDAYGNSITLGRKKSSKDLKDEIKKLTKLMRRGKGLSQDDLYKYEEQMELLQEQLKIAV